MYTVCLSLLWELDCYSDAASDVSYACPVEGDSTCGQRAVYGLGMTGIPIYNVNNNCSTGSTALFLAKQLVEGGFFSGSFFLYLFFLFFFCSLSCSQGKATALWPSDLKRWNAGHLAPKFVLSRPRGPSFLLSLSRACSFVSVCGSHEPARQARGGNDGKSPA
jgi:hypothetical protein